MELLMFSFTWLGYLFAFIGFSATIYKALHVWYSFCCFDWQEFDKFAKKVICQINEDNYFPDVILTIGRGGAILGAVVSGNLHSSKEKSSKHNIPLLGCDRVYQWNNGYRNEFSNELVDFTPLKNKKILLVAGDVLTGGTMQHFVQHLKEYCPEKIKTACLVKGATATVSLDYVGKVIAGDFQMPWMYKGFGYIRDSRRPT